MNRTRWVLELGVGLGFLLTVVLTLAMGWRQRVAAQVRADTIRLHVLANSDTIEDQLLKLEVRDAILAALPATATVRLENFAFDARDYGSFALPGGTYTALRVEVGAALGHNWFCVLYPALCVSGATAEYPTRAENALVFGQYEVRFALLDALKGR